MHRHCGTNNRVLRWTFIGTISNKIVSTSMSVSAPKNNRKDVQLYTIIRALTKEEMKNQKIEIFCKNKRNMLVQKQKCR